MGVSNGEIDSAMSIGPGLLLFRMIGAEVDLRNETIDTR